MSSFIIPPEADVAFSYAPGKVILVGEHAVVYGAQAIALPIDCGIRVAVSRLGQGIEGPILRGVGPFLMGDIRLGNDEHGPKVLKLALAYLIEAFGKEITKLLLVVDGSLPAGRGLGSSAAFSVALIRGLYRFFAQNLNESDLLRHSLALETIFHGQPSGIDHNAVVLGRMIGFQRQEHGVRVWPIGLGADLSFAVGIVGPHDGTKQAVNKLAERKKRQEHIYHRIFDELDFVAKDLEKALPLGLLARIGELMNVAQGYLNALGVSTPEIEKLCAIARDRGALGAKLTGAGGGGAVIALADGNEEALVDAFRAAGYQGFVSRISGYKITEIC